jgi:sec-independent protein translocase protein TatA
MTGAPIEPPPAAGTKGDNMGAGLLSPVHLLLLGVVGLLLFGAKRLPEVGRSLGTGLREFKTSVTAMEGSHEPNFDFSELEPAPEPEITKVA